MIDQSIIKSFLREADLAYKDLLVAESSLFFTINTKNWFYSYFSVTMDSRLEISCEWHVNMPDPFDKQAYDSVLGECDNQIILFNKYLKNRILKSKYSNLILDISLNPSI